MDGRGRWLDNVFIERLRRSVKYEDVYLKAYDSIRKGVFRSVKELEIAVMNFINKHNDNPKIFTWTKDVNTILSKVGKCKEALGTVR